MAGTDSGNRSLAQRTKETVSSTKHPRTSLPHSSQTLVLLTLPHRKAHHGQHTYKHTGPHYGIWGERSNSHSVAPSLTFLRSRSFIFRGRMGLTGSLSRNCCWCRSAFHSRLRQDPDQRRKSSIGRKNGLSSPTLSGSCVGHRRAPAGSLSGVFIILDMP